MSSKKKSEKQTDMHVLYQGCVKVCGVVSVACGKRSMDDVIARLRKLAVRSTFVELLDQYGDPALAAKRCLLPGCTELNQADMELVHASQGVTDGFNGFDGAIRAFDQLKTDSAAHAVERAAVDLSNAARRLQMLTVTKLPHEPRKNKASRK